MGISFRPIRGHADELEQFLDPSFPLLGCHLHVGLEGLLDLVADSVDRVEGVHRALEDHRDLGPSHGLHPIPLGPLDRAAGEAAGPSAFAGRICRMPKAKVVLPHPDSPTRPTVLLRSAVKSTPSTALTWPLRTR